jgi:hypothetical protein
MKFGDFGLVNRDFGCGDEVDDVEYSCASGYILIHISFLSLSLQFQSNDSSFFLFSSNDYLAYCTFLKSIRYMALLQINVSKICSFDRSFKHSQ